MKLLFNFLLCVVLLTLVANSSEAKVQASVSSLGETIHLEFTGNKEWNYKLKRLSDKKISLIVPKVESSSKSLFLKKKYKKLIKKISIRPKNKLEDEFIIDLTSKAVESFDYLTDQPSRLIVDFYYNKDLLNKKVSKKVKKKKNKFVKVDSLKDKNRKPAWDEALINDVKYEASKDASKAKLVQSGIYDAADPFYERFKIENHEIDKNSILNSQNNIYLRFPALITNYYDFDKQLNKKIRFVIQPDGRKENQDARFLLNLYNKKRYAKFLKVYRYFTNKYKSSKYNQIVHNLAAETYFRNWIKTGDKKDYERAKDKYTYLIKKYGKSPASERALLLLAYSEYEANKDYQSIAYFEKIISEYPSSHVLDSSKMTQADSLVRLGKVKNAREVYLSLAKETTDPMYKEISKIKIGDTYFRDRDFSKAISVYEKSFKNNPKLSNTYPSLLFNLAESLFWIGDYKKSLGYHIEFLKYFPDHKFVNFSLTRIGENLDILGADKKKSINAYLESSFRFPEGRGAQIAKIRMTSQRMPSMKQKELEKSIEKMREMARKSRLPSSSEFATVMISEGLKRRGDYKASIDTLATHYKKNTLGVNQKLIKNKIVDNVLLKLKSEKSDPAKSLMNLNKLSSTWLRDIDRPDFDYIVGDIYSGAGAAKESVIYFNKVLKKIGKPKNQSFLSKLPNEDQINLRISKELYRSGDFNKSLKTAKSLNPNKLSDEGRVQRIEILSDTALRRGYRSVVKKDLVNFIENWKSDKKYLTDVYLKLLKVHTQDSEFSEAKKIIEKSSMGKVSMNSEQDEEYLRLQKDIYSKTNQPQKAIAVMNEYLKQYPKNNNAERIRYNLGDHYFMLGNLSMAETSWKPLKVSKSFYWKIVKDKIDQSKWDKSYKKYMSRIPASIKENGTKE